MRSARDQRIDGPAIVVETMATTFIDPLWQATVDPWGHLRLAAKHAANAGIRGVSDYLIFASR